MPSITVRAHAKLNLTLDVLGRRSDGFHEMRMVMQSVALCDLLTLESGTGRGLEVSTNRAFLPVGEKNLAGAAALRFMEATGAELGGLSIRIQKRVPVCAGMAGGSSDAAAVLRALNELAGTGLGMEALASIGARVGSDVPYCVHGCTALAEGRGETLTALPPLPPCHIVLCKPAFPVSTPELFGKIDTLKLRRRPDTAGVVAALEAGDLGGVARRLYNVFEDTLPERRRGEVGTIKNTLIQHGAIGACMSGTGPTVFGLFTSENAARGACDELAVTWQETFLTSAV